MKRTHILVFCFAAAMTGFSTVHAGDGLNGEWNGKISIMGTELGIKAQIEGAPENISVKLDIPMQNAFGLPMQNASYERPRVHFEIPGAAVAVFEGEFKGDTISGDFLQSGLKGSFVLTRGIDSASAEPTDSGEVAVEDLPYNEEEVEFVNGEFKFAGTLTLPRSTGPFPAVVMITGSGPQNRDEELLGFKPFRLIADYLTREGIAVLRYDDRGVGGSTGSVNDATSVDFATDVVAAARFLEQRDDINGEQIGAIGHSEGGIIAPLAAQSGELAFVVLLAGTAITGEEILFDQGRLIGLANGASAEELRIQRETQEMLMHAVRTDENWDQVEAVLTEQTLAALEKLPEEKRAAIEDPDQYVKTQVEAQITGTRTAWFRAFIDYDPVPALEALKVPALAIFGEVDLQVPPLSNSERMKKAFKQSRHKQYRIEILAGANHLFQKATTGSPTEYATLEKAFVPELLPMIVGWIREVL